MIISSFILWCLALFGLVNGINNSSLLRPLVNAALMDTSKVVNKLGELLLCPMCLGFWFGMLFSLLIFNPVVAFAIGWKGIILSGFVGSASCWILSALSNALFRHGLAQRTGGCGGCGGNNSVEE
ncbi:hypothetical protein HOE37_06570 [Candidatus Woesearchaeota archaeon]|jgi:uncharacterized membrane protein|nr:hypothetical protein [Candidatus Woesearchaeota archaeon]